MENSLPLTPALELLDDYEFKITHAVISTGKIPDGTRTG